MGFVAGVTGLPHWGITAGREGGQLTAVFVEPNGLAWGRSVREGDVILAVDDESVADEVLDYERLNRAHSVVLMRPSDGRTWSVTAPTVSDTERLIGLTTPIVGLFFLLAGVLVVFHSVVRQQTLAFGVFSLCAAVMLAAVPAGKFGHPWGVRLTAIGVMTIPTCFLWLSTVFPAYRFHGTRRAKALLAVSCLLVFAALVSYVSVLLGVSHDMWMTQVLSYGNMVFGLGCGLVLLLLSYSRERNVVARQRVQIVIGGTAVAIITVLFLTIIPRAILTVGGPIESDYDGFIVAPEISLLATALIPLSFTYAILRQQIARAERVVRRGTLYLTSTITITICYLLAVSLFQMLYDLVTGHTGLTGLILAALVVAVGAEPIRRTAEDWMERVFFSDIRAYREILSWTGHEFDGILSVDDVVAKISDIVTAALPVERFGLFIERREDKGFVLEWDHLGRREDCYVLRPGNPILERVEREQCAVTLPIPFTVVAKPCATLLPERERRRKRRRVTVDPESREFSIDVVVPLRAGGHSVALLALDRRTDGEAYSGADLEFLDSAAARFAIALDNALLHDAVRQQAERDALTGLYNYGYVMKYLAQLVERCTREHSPLALLMMDINGFKFFNDTFGHPAGDRVLVEVGLALQSACRTRDVVARYGGDEFLLVLPDLGREDAVAVADRISDAVAEIAVSVEGYGSISLSLSIGIAVMPEDGETPLQLISAADVAMYGRKRAPSVPATTIPDTGDIPPGPMQTLLIAVQQKDGYVAGHSERAAHWAVQLGAALGLSEYDQQTLRIAGLLHDVGKVGVPESLLNKPGTLTAEERAMVERHVELGLLLIDGVPHQEEVLQAVAHHHERWDGRGYPNGIAGEDIPLLGRIMAIADAYSAMTTTRSYRARLPLAEAANRLRAEAGSQFDPELVKVFLTLVSDDEPAGLEHVAVAPR